jgi:pyruvate decarboxylase
MGKGFNETLKNFAGLYGGGGSYPEVKKYAESADVLLWIGRYGNDFNTGEFTVKVNEKGVIDLQRFWLTIGGSKFHTSMNYTLAALVESLKKSPLSRSAASVTWDPYPSKPEANGALTQDFLWHALGSFFQPGDLIIGETGTSAFGLGASKLPENTFMFNQTIFGSIGYATGAALGSFMAAQETGKFKRGILVTGEGSLHLTAQAIADLLRYDVKPIM